MSILNETMAIQETMVVHRRYVHQNAEQHLDLPKTSAYVEEKLTEMGYTPQRVGASGIVALAGGKKPGKVFLLRADMDALPIDEASGVPFSCTTGSMHACGHDIHTAMLLGAAQVLKNHEDEIEGTVKLMFQPAEETLAGAKMMIDNGVLENPKVDAAMMIHVLLGTPLPTGTIVIPDPRRGMSASDWFKITVQGKGSHGAMPDAGVDPLNVMSHIHLGLQTVNSREISPTDAAALTVGQMHGGTTSNVIPDTSMMSGTLRTMDNEVRDFAKQRIVEIAEGIATSFRASAQVVYERGCPCFQNDKDLLGQLAQHAKDLFGENGVWDSASQDPSKTMGSEDFSWISMAVPAVYLAVSAGSPEEGYQHPLHHPKATFNEDALPIGAALYANSALEWLAHNC